ncbi:MAG: hypothetical protein IJY12_05720 [Clostridia bacterium]|nr:hypothetical protein [Clostridia bacterium]
MKFMIRKNKIRKAETLYAYLAVVMCVAVFLVYCMTSVGNGAVAVGKDIGSVYRNWVQGTAFYEFFGFSEVEETPPSESVYTYVVHRGRTL